MKNITLDDIKWVESPNYTNGRTQEVSSIIIHWWNTPEKAGNLNETVNYLLGADVSIHFVVSDDEIIQMVNMGNTAWHALHANPFSVGIEVDPRTPGNTYETVGALVELIRGYYGEIPVEKHSDYVATQCPGTIDVQLIRDIASGKEDYMYNGKTAEQWFKERKKYRKAWKKETERRQEVQKKLKKCRAQRDRYHEEKKGLKADIVATEKAVDELRQKLEARDEGTDTKEKKLQQLEKELSRLRNKMTLSDALRVVVDKIKQMFR